MFKKLLLFSLLFALIVPMVFAQETGVELPQKFTSEDGNISMSLPAGWVAGSSDPRERTFIFIASSQETLLNSFNDPLVLGSGEVLLLIIPATDETYEFCVSSMEPGIEFETRLQTQAAEEENTTVGTVEAIDLPTRTVYRGYITDSTTEGAGYLLDFDGIYMIAAALTAPGEYANIEPTTLAVLDTLVIESPSTTIVTGRAAAGSLAGTRYSDSGQLSFSLPEDWIVFEVVDYALSITNAEDGTFSRELDPGQLYINIIEPQGLSSWGVLEYSNAQDAFESYIRVISNGMGYTSGEPEEVILGENTFQQVQYESEDGGMLSGVDDLNEEGFIALLVVDGHPLLIHVRFPKGDYAAFEPQIAQIMESLVFTPIDVPEPIETTPEPASSVETASAEPLVTMEDFGAEIVWQVQMPIDNSNAPGTELENVMGLGVDHDDRLYIANHDYGIVVMNEDGAVLEVLDVSHDIPAQNEAGGIYDVLVLGNGDVWVADGRMGHVRRLNPEGLAVDNIPIRAEDESASPLNPATVVFAPDSRIYTVDVDNVFDTYRLLSFEPSFPIMRHYDLAVEPNLLSVMSQIAVNPASNLLIGTTRGSVLELSPEGEILNEIYLPGTETIRAVLVGTDGTLYVGDTGTDAVYRFDAEGNLLAKIGMNGAESGEIAAGTFYNIMGMELLSNGDLIVTDANQDYAQVVRIRFQ